ncbi:MAG: hypothetical protein ACRYFX_23350 [Janthinobacterium lividum]
MNNPHHLDQSDISEMDSLAYFRPPYGYFWRWAEEGEVVEWLLGTTITYREELTALLTGLSTDGLPPLGPVLLTLAACTNAWQESAAEVGLLQGLLHNLPPGGPPDEELIFHLSVARAFLDTIRQLPAGLRTGTAKEQLLRVLLAEDSAPRQVPARHAAEVLALLADVKHHAMWFKPGAALTRHQLRTDLLYFERAARRFATVHSLELRLRTGLNELPAPLDEAPAPPPPAEPAADLLAELAQDERTAGLARLVPYLQAALRLSHTARQAGEQPLGGVADLTNRGSLDRLLLSELAQDDLTLSARLAHGEALYLRREEPPRPQEPPRLLLLDTTLLMWGTPRVLGLAAALALAAPPGQAPAQAFALGGGAGQPLDLRSRPGVVAALELLDPALHCGAALLALLPLPAPAEAILITEAQAARPPTFLECCQAAPATLRFVLTVDRSGEVVLYERQNGRHVLLSTNQLDVEQALFPQRRSKRREVAQVRPPAFLRRSPAPLRLPLEAFTPEYDPRAGANACFAASEGLLAVVPSQRLLYWPESNAGAIELLPVVEAGSYYFGFGSNNGTTGVAYLLVRGASGGRSQLVLYHLYLSSLASHRVDLSNTTAGVFYFRTAVFENNTFRLEAPEATLVLDCENGTTTRLGPPAPDAPTLPFARAPYNYLNTSHQVLRRVPRLGLDAQGQLTLGDWQLRATDELATLVWRKVWDKETGPAALPHLATLDHRTPPLTGNRHVPFHRFAWPDGSEAIVDGRGLLHLRSADPALREVTLVLAVNTATAAWTSNNQLGGWHYFTGLDEKRGLSANNLYQAYLKPIFERIMHGQPEST